MNVWFPIYVAVAAFFAAVLALCALVAYAPVVAFVVALLIAAALTVLYFRMRETSPRRRRGTYRALAVSVPRVRVSFDCRSGVHGGCGVCDCGCHGVPA